MRKVSVEKCILNLGLVGACCLISVASAYAENITPNDPASADMVGLEPIFVFGKHDSKKVYGYVPDGSLVGSRTGASLLKTPQSVSVIGREELDDRNVQTATEALQYTPGVFASTGAIFRRFDFFSVRGFDSTLNGVLLDGLRSTTAQSYVSYQPYGMERVDVLRGPSGFLYGAGSPGGIVNMTSKRPTKEAHHEVGIQYGSFDRKQGQFDFSGPLTEDKTFLYRVVGVGRGSDTPFDYVPDNVGYIAPSITWSPNEDTSLTVLTSLTRNEFGPARPYIPIYGTLLGNPNGKLPSNTYLDGDDLDSYLSQLNIGYDFDHRFDDVWSMHSAARYARTKLYTETLSGISLNADMRTLNRRAYQYDITGNIFSTDNSMKAQWDSGVVQGTTVAGISWRNTLEDYNLKFGGNYPIDIYNPVYDAVFSAETPYAKTAQRSNEVGIYAANTLTISDHVVVDLAVREDWVSVNTDNKLANTTSSQKDNAFTYRMGLSYLTDFGVVPYTSYTTSFAPVLGTDFYGDTYEPTHGKQVEVGIKYQPTNFDAMFTSSWFHLVQDNVKTADPNNSMNSIQTGEVTSQGIELSGKVNITPSFQALANYTYNDLETTQTTQASALGKVPTEKPAHMASLWGDYTFDHGQWAGLGLGAGMRYVGSSYADTANTIKVPSSTLFDAALRYDFGKKVPKLEGVKLSLNASNLFNKQYYTTCSSTSCNEGYDRNITATLSYSW